MPAQPPILDDRVLQDILAQLQALAREDLPAWRPPPEGDAGTMLQRIYARLLELTLQRLNQVPEKNLLAFLDTMGISLLAPAPARVPLTFALTPGTPPTLVPRAAQAGTKANGQQPAVIFETEDDLTVIPAQLAVGFTMDPVWDRYTNQTSVLSGQSPTGFTPFVGVKRMPHILYIGDDTLLNISPATRILLENVEVRFNFVSSHLREEILDFFFRLSYQYLSQGKVQTVSVQADVPPGSENLIILSFSIPSPIDQETIEGVGLAQGIQNRWLRAVLETPFPDEPVARDLRLSNPKLNVVNSVLLPDFAFSNATLVDVTKDFFPFGEAPKVGDAFYIGSQEVFSKPAATVTISVTVAPPMLVWEYWNGAIWKPLTPTDTTINFTKDGTISLPRPTDMALTRVGEETAFWFRVRLQSGHYPGVPRVNKFLLTNAQTTLAADVVRSQTQITLTDPTFANVDDVLLVGDEFVEIFSDPDGLLKVRPPFLRRHERGTPVERQVLSLPIGALLQVGQLHITQLIVNTTEEIAPGDIIRLGNQAYSHEFIIVREVNRNFGAPGLAITTLAPLQFQHPIGDPLRRVTAYFVGFADGERVDFTEPFFPFGEQLRVGDIFYFGTTTGFPLQINIDVNLQLITPDVQLTWEYLDKTGWQSFLPTDGTNNWLQDANVVFPSKPVFAAEVNGQKSLWIRVRISGGNYGLPIEFVAVNPNDPKQGFTVKRGTGNLNPPIITNLTINYQAERPPTVLTQNGFLYDQPAASATTDFAPFVSVKDLMPPIYADAEPSFYLGFDAAFPEQPVRLYVAIEPRAFTGSGVKEPRVASAPSSALPALQWEYFNGTTWRGLTVLDETNNLTESGTLEFLTPTDIASLAKFDLTPRYWIRARSSENDPFNTQQVLGVFLNTIPAIQAVTVPNETLGSSNGQPDQTLHFARPPVLPGQQVLVREPEPPSDQERAAIEAEEGKDAVQARSNPTTGETEIWVRWHEVANFLRSEPHSRHYTFDHTTGLIAFGDGKRGQVPPRGTNNIAATYRTGGGTAGNAPPAAIAQIKSPLPGVATVTNPVAAGGGAVAETVKMVEERGPQTLRHRQRAVACGDLEWLARQAAGTAVARAKCLSNINREFRFEPGWVTLIIIPHGTEAKLTPGPELIREVEDYLEARAFVGLSQQTPARINVIGPGYIQVTVIAEVVPQDINQAASVKQRALAALVAFFHPLTGGPDGTGWEFARDVFASEIDQLLEGIPGVDHVKSLDLVPNIAQHRLTFLSPLPPTAQGLPEGSIVMTTDRLKSALLAEAVPITAGVTRIATKGFKEGDRITRVLDLTTPIPDGTKPVDGVSRPKIKVDGFRDAVGFPRGSLVMTLDGTRRTHLAQSIPRDKDGQDEVKEIVVEDEAFVSTPSPLQPGDVLTVFYPFPITVTSVKLEKALIGGSSTPVQTLGIEPYEAEVEFRVGSILATLDNHVRMPLQVPLPAAESLPADQSVTVLQVGDFRENETVSLIRRDGAERISGMTIQTVQPATDVVYLDDNFLVYSGAHLIKIVSE